MAENDPAPTHHPKAAPQRPATGDARGSKGAKDATQESEAVKTDNENYIGIDPIYAQSAYEEPLNPEEADVPKDASDEEKEAAEAAFEAEQEMTQRVQENEAGNVVEIDEVVPFDEWAETSPDAERKATVSGVDQERVEVDRAKTEEAKEDGKIPPRSTSLHQPGVNTAS